MPVHGCFFACMLALSSNGNRVVAVGTTMECTPRSHHNVHLGHNHDVCPWRAGDALELTHSLPITVETDATAFQTASSLFVE